MEGRVVKTTPCNLDVWFEALQQLAPRRQDDSAGGADQSVGDGDGLQRNESSGR